MKAFFRRKNVLLSPKIYFIESMGAMAKALFATLLVGTILKTLGEELDIPFLKDTVWKIASQSTGAAIALSVAYSLMAPQLVMFSATVVGFAAYPLGGPLGAFIASVIATEIGKLISGETQMDIVITPSITVLAGIAISELIAPSIQSIMSNIGSIIIQSTEIHPLAMSIIVAVVVGMVLTLPISSAALCVMLELEGLAAGAATIGCCAQMIGFATISYQDNGVKGVFAQGIGTSMLQMPNIYKNWKIWIPPTLASAMIAPLAVIFFKMKNTALESGMGSCGLVGQIGTYNAMKTEIPSAELWFSIVLLQFILPAVISYSLYLLMKNKGWIRRGDLKLKW